MKAQDIINHLQAQGSWVNWENTRDVVLYGNPEVEINKAGVCWIITTKALKQAIAEGVNFIISHENPFYEATTIHTKRFLQSATYKKQLMKENNICAYRCHDVWDNIPEYGIADIWAKVIDLPFGPRELKSYNTYAYFSALSVKAVAKKVAEALVSCGQDTVQVIGDPDKMISSVVIGTGAAIDVNRMLTKEADAIILSDDGCMTYQGVQYCLDNDIPVIRVNHSICEIPGMLSMRDYLKEKLNVETIYLHEGYDVTAVKATD